MITKEDAERGGTFYHRWLRNADGSALRARVNGSVKTWKRQPGRFRVPMKHGLRNCFYIDTIYTKHGPDCWFTFDPTLTGLDANVAPPQAIQDCAYEMGLTGDRR